MKRLLLVIALLATVPVFATPENSGTVSALQAQAAPNAPSADTVPEEPGMIPVPGGKLGALIKFAGKFHVMVVHFPIALVLTAALAELLKLVLKRPFFGDTARFLILLGAASALVTVPLGFAAGTGQSYADEYARVFWFHAAFGTTAGILVLSSAAASLAAAKTGKRIAYLVYYLSLAAATILIGLTGHFGATLVHGLDYFQ